MQCIFSSSKRQRRRSPGRSSVVLLSALAISACTPSVSSAPIDPGREARRHRAALATIIVDNRTTLPLFIGFRPAIGPGAEIIIGNVGAHATATVAPIPAGEPIIMLARDPTGLQLELPSRSFAIDTTWTWLVPADAHFTSPAGTGS
jgi:hypothetical protein